MSPLPQMSPRAKRIARLGGIGAASALTLGSAGAQPLSDAEFIAKTNSLGGVQIAAAQISPIVREEVVQVQPEVAETPKQTAVRAARCAAGDALACIRACESGGNYNAVSSSGKYRGAYQFDQRTWESQGGTGDPAAASPEEQDMRARSLYAQRGGQPWPVCSRR